VLCTRWSLSSFMTFFRSRTLCNSHKKWSHMSGGHLVHHVTFPFFPTKCYFNLVASPPRNSFTQYLPLNPGNKFSPCSHTTSLSPIDPATMDETKQMYHKNSYQDRHIRAPSQIPERSVGHVRPPNQIPERLSGHVRPLSRIPERLAGHVQPPTRTCLDF
jgi:hypothetical protein